ncbi:MAG: hypothetical protein WBB45_21585 [Cyclobacteriaceae bacterium]
MKDRLKEYIEEHRKEFDTESPSAGLWDKIASDLDDKKSKPQCKRTFLRPWMGVAATILLVALAYWAGTLNSSEPAGNNQIATQDSREVRPYTNSNATEEFVQAVNYYRDAIQDRKAVVKGTAESDSLQKYMLADLQELDVQFEELSKEQHKVPSEKVTSAMILNLQMQLRILNRQLEFLNRKKEVKNDSDIRQL